MSELFLDQLSMPEPNHLLGVGSGTHAEQIAGVMEALERLVAAEPPDLAFVPCDVNSTLGAALVFAKLGIPYGHVESGLRSFDRSMPEEINRIVADGGDEGDTGTVPTFTTHRATGSTPSSSPCSIATTTPQIFFAA